MNNNATREEMLKRYADDYERCRNSGQDSLDNALTIGSAVCILVLTVFKNGSNKLALVAFAVSLAASLLSYASSVSNCSINLHHVENAILNNKPYSPIPSKYTGKLNLSALCSFLLAIILLVINVFIS